MDEKTILSIGLISYNQGKYLRQALDSILNQKVNFKYEIVIGDDCSTDDSLEILNEYKKKYNDKLKILCRDKNIGVTKNCWEIFMECKGDYIALLEGDDYWIDNTKLQKQVDFLNENKNYIGCAHVHYILNVNKNSFSKANTKRVNGELDFEYAYKKDLQNMPHSNTLVFRNIFTELDVKYKKFFLSSQLIGDALLYLILLDHGKIFILKDIMSVWRFVKKEGEGNYNSYVYTHPDEKIIDDQRIEHMIKQTFNHRKIVYKHNNCHNVVRVFAYQVRFKKNYNFFKIFYKLKLKEKIVVISKVIKIFFTKTFNHEKK